MKREISEEESGNPMVDYILRKRKKDSFRPKKRPPETFSESFEDKKLTKSKKPLLDVLKE